MAENTRTATQAAIKRATMAAQRAMDSYDAKVIDDLARIYKEAAGAITEQIAQLAGADTVQIQVLQELLVQVKTRLNLLTKQRDQLLDTGLVQAANLGAQPFAAEAATGVMATSVTNVVHDAVEFVRHFVAADGLQLSDRIWRLDKNAQQAVANAIEAAVIQGHSASQAAADFLSRGLPVPADIARKIDAAKTGRIQQAAWRALLHDDGNAYEHAKRLFRTELNRAHGMAYIKSVEAHPDTVGTKFLLSPAHPRRDICDMHANANLYGLGKGVYPPGKNPWPAHPNTLSYVMVVFKDEVTDDDRAGKTDPISWLKTQSPDLQTDILGAKKAQALRDGELKANHINTPWKILKVRYAKSGD